MLMIIRLKDFHDSLNIVVILAPCCEFCSAECTRFPVTFKEWNKMKDIFSLIIIHSWENPYEINFKNHLNSVLLCK